MRESFVISLISLTTDQTNHSFIASFSALNRTGISEGRLYNFVIPRALDCVYTFKMDLLQIRKSDQKERPLIDLRNDTHFLLAISCSARFY